MRNESASTLCHQQQIPFNSAQIPHHRANIISDFETLPTPEQYFSIHAHQLLSAQEVIPYYDTPRMLSLF